MEGRVVLVGTSIEAPVLTGPELIAAYKQLSEKATDESAIAIDCGYVSPTGKARIGAFKDALLQAYGLGFTKPQRGSVGKPLSFNVACQKNGQIILSAGYAALLGLVPGDRVEIEHDAEDGVLVLAKGAGAADPEEPQDDADEA